jgi:hypothetical protein
LPRRAAQEIERKAGRMFFFEKKNQKTFVYCPRRPRLIMQYRRDVQERKVFWFFFSKKNTLPSHADAPGVHSPGPATI